MTLDQKILSLLGSNDYSPLRAEELSQALELTKAEARQFRRILHNLLDDGLIARIKKDRLVLPRDANLVSGTIRFRQSGSALLIPEPVPGKAAPEPFEIRAEDTATALHGDKVLCREENGGSRHHWQRHRNRPNEPQKRYVRVIRVLKRAFETMPGTLKRSRAYWYVIADEPRITQDILVPSPENCLASVCPKENDKVIVRLHEWKQRHLNPEGEIIEVLGHTHEPQSEFKALLHKYDLNPQFPSSVVAQAQSVPEHVRADQIRGRMDCRELFTFTIDPDDAKDFDDALSIEQLPRNRTRIGIHIADVSAYVKQGSALDKEAQERGNSTYLVGCVIPMLPHELSNGICSLVEGQDRLTKSVFLTFDAKNKIVQSEFANSVIRSDKRLTYRQAYALMGEEPLAAVREMPVPPAHQTGSTGKALAELSDKELQALREGVKGLWHIASKLRAARMDNGSLDLDIPEVKIFVDEKGYADRIEKIEYDESHQLIEEYMLAANEAVARALNHARLPFLSRVHDEPAADKLNELRQELLAQGLDVGDLTLREEVKKFLAAIKDHPQGYALRIQFLRSLKHACYRAEADGHYGLNKQFYAHFTSPIRRYSDLVVHRIFEFYLFNQGIESAAPRVAPSYSKGELDKLGQHLSITEVSSSEAERESVKIKLLEYFERELQRPKKRTFEAIITEVRNHGLFIELTHSLAFGFVHVSTFDDDMYYVSPDGTALVGRRHGGRYGSGDLVSVTIERVDRFKRQMDFRIVELLRNNQPAAGKHHNGKGKYGKNARKDAAANDGWKGGLNKIRKERDNKGARKHGKRRFKQEAAAARATRQHGADSPAKHNTGSPAKQHANHQTTSGTDSPAVKTVRAGKFARTAKKTIRKQARATGAPKGADAGKKGRNKTNKSAGARKSKR